MGGVQLPYVQPYIQKAIDTCNDEPIFLVMHNVTLDRDCKKQSFSTKQQAIEYMCWIDPDRFQKVEN